ncbi:RecQ family zinc-binding domain-containing protein [Myxococcota bacterium]|nr:RecQ family zinc-binding domain-containing protein [Myxococcota bacterium]
MAASLGQPRERVVRAVTWLSEQGLVEVRASDVRQRYARRVPAPDLGALAAELSARFARREAGEIGRVRDMAALVTHAGCQTAFLVRHFREELPGPCGHCTFCETGEATAFPPPPPRPPVASLLATPEVTALLSDRPPALLHPRKLALFLCGLSSPALVRARLTRHPLFGAAAGYPFAQVMEGCAALPTPPPTPR